MQPFHFFLGIKTIVEHEPAVIFEPKSTECNFLSFLWSSSWFLFWTGIIVSCLANKQANNEIRRTSYYYQRKNAWQALLLADSRSSEKMRPPIVEIFRE